MKFFAPLAVLTLFAFASCEIDEPPPQRKPRPARYPRPQETQYPAQPQPFPQDQVPPTQTAPPAPESAPPQEPQSAPVASTTAKGDYPYGVPVPGKAGFVRSPFSPDKMTDVRGYAPGTEVKDPYTGKIFLVP
ncbi:MAG: hypothetical protein M3Y03_00175 [Verrucomicrobiota bacterium]|nr:hypothetical protein [Verrucomicrobiota bacterium]